MKFKFPQPPKKQKTSICEKTSDVPSSSEISVFKTPEIENQSQLFLQSVKNKTSEQVNNCIDLVEDENFLSVISNPVTCSQYFQQVAKIERTPDDTLDNLFNNEIDQISTVDPRTSLETSGIKASANLDYRAALYIDSDVFECLDEDELKGNKQYDSKKKINNPSTSKIEAKTVEIIKFKESFRPKMLPVSSSAYQELGPFFGLSSRHKKFILKTKNIDSLYDWQEECLGLRAIHDKTNLIYALPTSGGKTLVAEIAMFREILLRKKNIIFVMPYVSIVQEKVQDLMPFAFEFNFLVEEYCAGKGSIPPIKRRKKNVIYVCTIEKSLILFDSLQANGRLNEVGMIVVDELHMVGDSHRGYSLEVLLAKTVFQNLVRIQVIGEIIRLSPSSR